MLTSLAGRAVSVSGQRNHSLTASGPLNPYMDGTMLPVFDRLIEEMLPSSNR
jgi:hypothetical protein